MARTVVVSEAAETDLYELYTYIARHDAPERAQQVVRRIEQIIASLSTSPERGAVLPEFAAKVGEYREGFFKPCRIVYKVLSREVLVLLVADGRRDMDTLLQRRLLA